MFIILFVFDRDQI